MLLCKVLAVMLFTRYIFERMQFSVTSFDNWSCRIKLSSSSAFILYGYLLSLYFLLLGLHFVKRNLARNHPQLYKKQDYLNEIMKLNL